ncbi:hypothetical protein EJ06DRAFT_271184 [Trichodelitschia bisporula]|uniref:Uncharacterized protein n=1 Tax=Trichodelitschia bisporula TaxID=703511 RepID=A0A6G1HHI4_9PEZI|nr:hypothetical protein EJ06DRAFT_271184 [Trichodelitschia bisporula]
MRMNNCLLSALPPGNHLSVPHRGRSFEGGLARPGCSPPPLHTPRHTSAPAHRHFLILFPPSATESQGYHRVTPSSRALPHASSRSAPMAPTPPPAITSTLQAASDPHRLRPITIYEAETLAPAQWREPT